MKEDLGQNRVKQKMVDGHLSPHKEDADHAITRKESDLAIPLSASLHAVTRKESDLAIPLAASLGANDKTYNLSYDEADLQTLILFATSKMTGRSYGIKDWQMMHNIIIL